MTEVERIKAEYDRLHAHDLATVRECAQLHEEIERLRGRLVTRRKVFDAVWVTFVVLGCSFAIILGMHWLIYGPHHCD